MKHRILLLLLAVAICALSACGDPAEPAGTEPSAVSAASLYESALVPIRNTSNLLLTISVKQHWQVGKESFSESFSATASYSGLGSAAMDAHIQQDIQFGTFQAQYEEFYTGGTAYCRSGANTIACAMTSKGFVDRQIPVILLDPALYGSITAENMESRTLICFSDAAAMESWAAKKGAALRSAKGTATLDPQGNLLQSAYRAEYELGGISYFLEVTNKVATPAALDLTDQFPADLGNCPLLTEPDVLRTLLEATGYIRTAGAITCRNEELLDCKAAGILRTQQVLVDTYGSGEDFIARTEYSGSITDYTGKEKLTKQTELFLDGVKSVSIDNSAPITQPGYTAGQMQSYCQSAMMSALFPVAYLKDAGWTEEGSTRTLHFTGTEVLADALCANIYDSLQTGNLDSFCESYATDDISGYLTFDAATGLPVKIGLSLGRTHVIGGIAYKLIYTLNTDLTLASETAYETITGKAE